MSKPLILIGKGTLVSGRRKRTPADPLLKARRQLAVAENGLAGWERKLKLAQTKLKKWRKRLARCQHRFAVARLTGGGQ